jgi:ATP-dependent Clp protease adapter protein ClpS
LICCRNLSQRLQPTPESLKKIESALGHTMNTFIMRLLSLVILLASTSAFSVTPSRQALPTTTRLSPLHMSSVGSTDKSRTTKKGVQVIDKVETQVEQKKNKEEEWRVVLHNDEVHTFNYVVRSLCKVIGTLDRKAAFEICVQTHGIGKATITKVWKKQAEQFCLGLQRQGLTVSIAPDEDFDGGHSGGGL